MMETGLDSPQLPRCRSMYDEWKQPVDDLYDFPYHSYNKASTLLSPTDVVSDWYLPFFCNICM